MKRITTGFCLLFILLFSVAYAEDFPKDFTFRTVDGVTLDAKALKGKALVISIISHW